MQKITPETLAHQPGSTLRSKEIILSPSISPIKQTFLSDDISVVCLYKIHVNDHDSAVVLPLVMEQMEITDHVLVTLDVEETIIYKNIINFYKEFYHHLSLAKLQKKIKNFSIIINRSYGHDDENIYETLFNGLDNLISLHWFMCSYSVLYPKTIPRNSNSDKVLFLPGKLHRRPQRSTVLFTILANENYRKRCEYAYTVNQSNWNGITEETFWQDIYSYVKDFNIEYDPTFEEVKSLFIENQRDIDGLQAINEQFNNHMLYPVQQEIYNSCSLELIAETWWPNSFHHLTEKTFRAMLAGQVFVHLNSMHTKYLHKLGFRTFVHLGNNSWHREGWENIPATMFCQDRDMKIVDLKNNLHRAFDLAKDISEGNYKEIDNIINHNRSLCEQYLKEYSNTLNAAHDDLFTPDIINKLYSVHGAW